jgi:hypothetical protein
MSNKIFYLSIFTLISIILFVNIENYYLAYNAAIIGLVLFVVSIFVKIFEYMELLEQRTRPSYEELEKIFNEHFIKKKKKNVEEINENNN